MKLSNGDSVRTVREQAVEVSAKAILTYAARNRLTMGESLELVVFTLGIDYENAKQLLLTWKFEDLKGEF